MNLTAEIVGQKTIEGTDLTPVFLDCNLSEITKILEQKTSGIYGNLASLKTVDLSGLTISSIDPGCFRPQKDQLFFIDLSKNDLQSVTTHHFKDLNKLSIVNLSNNRIQFLESNSFSGLNKISYIDLSDNHIEILEANSFSGLENLVSINFYDNEISSIEPNAFCGLKRLEEINLNENELKLLDKNTFAGYLLIFYDIILIFRPKFFILYLKA